MPAADRDALPSQQAGQHACAREGMLQMQFVDPAHQPQIRVADWTRLVVDARSGNVDQLDLAAHRQRVIAVNHRFPLSNPALPSACSKKSFSSVNWPIFACSAFTSTGGSAAVLVLPPPNTSAACSANCCFHSVIWLGCTSYCWANSASVLSPLSAAMATLALKVAEWVRLLRFVIFWILYARHYGRLRPQLFHLADCPNFRRHLSTTCSTLLPKTRGHRSGPGRSGQSTQA
ncbi:protein of unknown function (plasmid) [Cupriavidus taiwanensis]|uniref:Uncharacterized protein n=1 Tax=Cupriavidus taiwanensis TaxID=164546 RepID=A0A375HYJ4_9BURK|nr:protein of unknown function [Cupriavidus taiwanensis]SPD61747.1 protein of unknown function [Cupriavidus taiwanensis]SPD69567.1 protein of unknown function [Cupriavidus taiwanensis]